MCPPTSSSKGFVLDVFNSCRPASPAMDPSWREDARHAVRMGLLFAERSIDALLPPACCSWPSTARHRGCAHSFPGPPLHYVNWSAPWTSSPSTSASTCTFALGTGRPSEQLQQSWKQCSRPHYSSCFPRQCAPPRSAARDFGQTTQWAPLGTSSRCP